MFCFYYYVEHTVNFISPLCLIDGLIYVIIFKIMYYSKIWKMILDLSFFEVEVVYEYCTWL